jgi:cytochrome oxidase assembly protein ShyY1
MNARRFAYASFEAIVFTVVLAAVFLSLIMLGPDQVRRVELRTCTEDMACWNCEVHGNRRCG